MGSKPDYLGLLRHGKAAHNQAARMSEEGDHSAYDSKFGLTHITQSMLTDKGQWQLEVSGEWLRGANVTPPFDLCTFAETDRAEESAGRLHLPNAEWVPEHLLREQDGGELDMLSIPNKEKLLAKYSEAEKSNNFYFRPRGGESPSDMIENRICPFIDKISIDKFISVLGVCHGRMMEGFRHHLHFETVRDWNFFHANRKKSRQILNGMFHFYSKINPVSRERTEDFSWFMAFCPNYPEHIANTIHWDGNVNGWTPLKRKTFSSQELVDNVCSKPRHLNEDFKPPFEPSELFDQEWFKQRA